MADAATISSATSGREFVDPLCQGDFILDPQATVIHSDGWLD
jgi:hypothetical protein